MALLDMGPCDCDAMYVSSPMVGSGTCHAVGVISRGPSNTTITAFCRAVQPVSTFHHAMPVVCDGSVTSR